MTFSIRPVCEDDAAAIVALLNPIIIAGKFTAMNTPFTVDEQIEFIRRLPDRGTYHIAIETSSGMAVGIQDVLPAASIEGAPDSVGEISTFVALGWHRRGIGKQLTDATVAAAKAQGYLRLRAWIRRDNTMAVSFYRSQGFGIVDESNFCTAERNL